MRLPPLSECVRILGRVLRAEGIPATPADVKAWVSRYFAAASPDDKRDLRTLLTAAEVSVGTSLIRTRIS
jgi:hypothetical protein